MDPITDAQAHDLVEIGGIENPGICTLSGFKRETEWDIKVGKGTKGATVTLSQLPPAKGSIKFQLWTPEQFRIWNETFRPLFLYDPTRKAVNAVDIYHPYLADLGIKSVVTESISIPDPDGKGSFFITVELLEYLPPPKKSATSTPSGSTADKNKAGKTGGSDDPIADAQQAEIARLTELAQEPRTVRQFE